MLFSQKTVTLYLDDSSIRLLVISGRQVTKWAEMPVEPGLIEGNVILKEAEIAAKIKKLLSTQGVQTRKAVVGISGLLCLTRPVVLPHLPQSMIDEAVSREAKRVLPVPPDQLYLSWQMLPPVKDKMPLFLVAIPRKTTDALIRVLKQAGISTSVIDIKPLALTRMARQSTAIIVDTQPQEFDIVIMVDGIPQPIRTVPFPLENRSKEEKLALIRDDLDKTIKFYNSNNPEKPLGANTPVFVSGELADSPELCQFLSQEMWFPVLPLLSPLKCPEELDQGRYLANISLALKKELPQTGGPTLINVNSFPAVYRPKPISLFRVVALPSAIALVSFLVPMVMLVQSASANIDSMQGKLDKTSQLLKQKLAERQKLSENVTRLEKEADKTRANLASLVSSRNQIESYGSIVSGDLDMVVKNTPTNTVLTSINNTGTALTVNGRAPTDTAVVSYAAYLNASGRFSETVISSLRRVVDKENEDNESLDFTIVMRMKR